MPAYRMCACPFIKHSEPTITLQILGGVGYTNSSPAGRYLRDAKLGEIGGGTTEIRRLLVARALLKECRASAGLPPQTHASKL
jgi:hypothetical protein